MKQHFLPLTLRVVLTIPLTSILLLAGCATEPKLHFVDSQNRPDSQVVIDQYRCGGRGGYVQVDPRLYLACMDVSGYKLVEEK